MSERGSARVTVPDIVAAKEKRRTVAITAYDAPTARWGEAAGADILLVGDSLAMVVLGHDTTLAVTMDEMLHHTRAVTRSARRCLVVADMPFGSYQPGVAPAVDAGVRFLKEAAAHAVKLEGAWPEQITALVNAGIPVMGHVGLTPQSIHRFGGYRVQGRTLEDAEALLADALILQEAGCFSLVLEGVPAEVAAVITRRLEIPTIGIGAGPTCDGQVLVIHDLLGITEPPRPRFVTPYAELTHSATEAVRRWVEDVRAGRAPASEQSYAMASEAVAEWLRRHPES